MAEAVAQSTNFQQRTPKDTHRVGLTTRETIRSEHALAIAPSRAGDGRGDRKDSAAPFCAGIIDLLSQ